MPDPGDAVYIGSVLCNVHCWGIISDIETPSMMSATFEILGNDGAVTLDALVGAQGVPGEPADIVKMQYTSSIDDPADLPDNLTDDPIDVGKAYWIGNVVYMWDGEQYVQKNMGSQGPPGPVPNVTPAVQLLRPDDSGLVSEIIVSGTAANPGWLLKLKAPRGPQGENASIRDATDYSEVDSGPPSTGDVIAWDGANYAPSQVGAIMPRLYSVPEAAFTSYTGSTTRQTIATFVLPAQEYSWTPMVQGHLRAVGVELDADPLILGCEVRLGHATTGTLIGRGFGNTSTWTTIVPHYSTPTSTTDAITPDNELAVVNAGETGATTTIFVNLFNDGLLGTYNFNRNNAQLSVLVIPTGTEFGS